MGGRALKNTETRRYLSDEYYALETEVLGQLAVAFPGRKAVTIPAYAGKESFGDMDVLIESDGMTENVRDVLQAVFEPHEIVKNGNCYSFDVKQLQVDLILTPHEIFNTSLVYFSYNDLGNLMGRIYHKMGMKYGHEGLTYAVYEDNEEDSRHCLDVILVSRDHAKIFEIGGYSFERWSRGFSNLQEIFEFAIDTPYYHYGIFDLENRNHRSRVRDRKRPTYTSFLEWAKDKPGSYDWGDLTDHSDRTAFLPRINEFFPDFQAKYDAVIAKNEERKFINALLNGERVRELTGLDGIELGYLMKHLKADADIAKIVSTKPRTAEVEYVFDVTVCKLRQHGDWQPKNKNNKEVEDDRGNGDS